MSFETRQTAMEQALHFAETVEGNLQSKTRSVDGLIQNAEEINTFLTKDGDPFGAHVMTIVLGPVEDQDTGLPVSNPLERKNGVTALKDNQQLPFTVTTDDAKGFATTDTLTVSSSDDSVATVSEQDDGSYLVVAGNPGSAVVTVTDGTISGTLAIDVTAGDTASIVITPGDPEDVPAAGGGIGGGGGVGQ